MASLMLSACGDVMLPHVLGSSEVPESVRTQPRAVMTITDQDAARQKWPRLGDVPDKPDNFSPPSVIEAEKDVLRAMRDDVVMKKGNTQ